MSAPIIFWHFLQLGDFQEGVEDTRTPFTPAQWQDGIGSERKSAYINGANAVNEVSAQFAFVQNASLEGVKAFGRRIRDFKADWIAALNLGPGNLVFVRDPDGDTVSQDVTFTRVANAAGADVDVDLDALDVDWAVGDYVLFIDETTPQQVFELTQIKALPGGTLIRVDLANPYVMRSTVARAEYHLPDAYPTTDLRGPNRGEQEVAAQFDMTWWSSKDYVNGVSTDV